MLNKGTSTNTQNNFYDALTREKLLQIIESLKPPVVEFIILDKFIEEGGKMTRTLTMITSNEIFENIPEINTRHGRLKIKYTKYIEQNTYYFISNPKFGSEYEY